MGLAVRILVALAAFITVGAVVTRWPQLVLARASGPVAALCLAAAAGAAMAPGAPSALPAIDAALRAGLAVGVTAAAARARRQVWLLASTSTVVAGTDAELDWLAFAAVGVTLAMLVVGRRSWILGALIGACLAQVLLRLDLGGPTGTSAAVAVAVGGMLVASGLRRARPSTRRRAWITAGVLGAAAVAFSAAAGVAATRAQGDVRRGIDAGEDGLRAARSGDVGRAGERFGRSADAFAEAGDDLDRWWARPAMAVPIVGQQLRAVRILSAAGEDLAGAASTASVELDRQGLRVDEGRVDLATVERAAGAMSSARSALEQAGADVVSARSPWLVDPLVDAIDDLSRRVADARRDVNTAADVLDLAAPMLGRDGPRRYFLAVVTPAENRGSGGIVGNIGEIAVDGGRLALGGVSRVRTLNETVDDAAAAKVLPAIYSAAYGAWTVPSDLQNVTVAADFPTVAEALEAVVPLAGRGEVDGTVSVDPLAVAALLDVVGPVTVPSWPVPIDAGNAAAVLLHEQYVALAGDVRENFLGEVTFAVWGRLTAARLPSPAALAAKLAPVVRGRHIQLHSRRSGEQATLRRLGADGTLPRGGGHHLAVVTNNASESKADWFLRRAVDYRVGHDPATGVAEATVRVTLTNQAPSSGLPDYVLGGRLLPSGDNRQIVQIYTPFDLVSATVDGRPPPVALRSLGATGNWAHELDIVIPARSAVVIELELAGRLTTGAGQVAFELGRQPSVAPDEVSATFQLPERWRFTAARGGLAVSGSTLTGRWQLDRNLQVGALIDRN